MSLGASGTAGDRPLGPSRFNALDAPTERVSPRARPQAAPPARAFVEGGLALPAHESTNTPQINRFPVEGESCEAVAPFS